MNYLKLFQNIIRGYILKSPGSSPLKVSFEITYLCNSRCLICSRWQEGIKKQKKELSTNKIKEIIDQIIKLKIPGISFSGGEPLIRKDFREIAIYAKKRGIRFLSISTNGLPLQNKTLRETLLKYFNRVHISIDGSEKIHDALRGTPGCFKKVVKAAKKLVEEKNKCQKEFPKIVINFTLSEKNYKSLNDVIRIGKKIGVDSLSFQPIHNIESAGLNAKNTGFRQVSLLKRNVGKIIKKHRQFLTNQEEFYEKIPLFFENPEKLRKIRCWAGVVSIRIDPYGNVYTCQSMPPVGNLKEKSLKDILESKRLKKQLKNIHHGYHPICWLGCYAPLNLAIKNIFNPSKTLCFFLKYKK